MTLETLKKVYSGILILTYVGIGGLSGGILYSLDYQKFSNLLLEGSPLEKVTGCAVFSLTAGLCISGLVLSVKGIKEELSELVKKLD